MELDSGANNNLIGGTQTNARNVISETGGAQFHPLGSGDGIYLTGAGTSFNQIIGNSIGTDLTGAIALGNAGDGIGLAVGADSNTIGGAAGYLNYISANGGFGVDVLSNNNAIDFAVIGLSTNANEMNTQAFLDGAGWQQDTGQNNNWGTAPTLKHQP